MAWTAPITWVVGQIVNAADLNTHIRDNWTAWNTHRHGGASGDGSAFLRGMNRVYFDHITIPAAPGAGKLLLYAKAGQPFFRNETGGELGINYSGDGHSHT